jgi:hypothetical protein
MLGQLFHEKILYIKKQLAYKQHPIKACIDKFKQSFTECNMKLLCQQADDDEQIDTTPKLKLEYVQRSIIR